jgi:hypothetical protein
MLISFFRTAIVLQKSGACDVDVPAGLPTPATSVTASPTASGQQQRDGGGGHHDTDITTSAAVVSSCGKIQNQTAGKAARSVALKGCRSPI